MLNVRDHSIAIRVSDTLRLPRVPVPREVPRVAPASSSVNKAEMANARPFAVLLYLEGRNQYKKKSPRAGCRHWRSLRRSRGTVHVRYFTRAIFPDADLRARVRLRVKARHLTPPDLRAVRLRVKARLTYRLTPVTGHTRLHALAPRRLGCRNVQCRMSRVLSLWPRVLFSWLSTTPHLSSVPVSTRPVYHHIRSGPRSTSRRPGAQEPSVNASSRPPRASSRVSS